MEGVNEQINEAVEVAVEKAMEKVQNPGEDVTLEKRISNAVNKALDSRLQSVGQSGMQKETTLTAQNPSGSCGKWLAPAVQICILNLPPLWGESLGAQH